MPILPVLLTFLVCGCSGSRPFRGGHALTTGAVTQTLAQSDNPSQPSRQSQETIKLRTYTLPALSRRLVAPTCPAEAFERRWKLGEGGSEPKADLSRRGSADAEAQATSLRSLRSLWLSAPATVLEREETRATTELGAAQKDTARDLAAKLSSLKPIVWVGVALFIFGLASLFWPPLKAVIGSVTTSAAITLGGLALIILPTLIVGNELLILGAVAVVVGAWFLAHRHGHLRGQLAAAQAAPTRPAEASERRRKPREGRSGGGSTRRPSATPPPTK